MFAKAAMTGIDGTPLALLAGLRAAPLLLLTSP
jgi:hypothetical protein